MIEYERKLLDEYLHEHRSKVTNHLIRIMSVYLLISSIWNIIFKVFNLPYTRAQVSLLLICLAILLLLWTLHVFIKLHSKIMQSIILGYSSFLIICLYFGSGYTESWSFFLLIPLLAGIYGERRLLVYYSSIGLILLATLSIKFPKSTYVVDSIDVSNRILVYLILATFSFLLLNTFHVIYSKQVETVVNSMEKTIEEVVKSFIVSVEAKDTYTFGHSERVSSYAVELARLLPEYQEDEALRRLKLSGLVHDIGKINIPESILTKSGKLTIEEYEVIKTHSFVGARMIERIESLQELKDGVLFHHERWDGQGYPTKSKGENIPLDARILAIADSFDAMTSNRSYRSGMSVEEAFRRLDEGSGTQFDPHLIHKLQSAKLRFIKIYKDSQDPVKEFETLTDLL